MSQAEPEGYIRVFVDKRSLMQMLLAQWLPNASSTPLRDYAIHLLSEFDIEPHGVMASQEKASPAGNVIESLSQREQEVLSLVGAGFSNRQIAENLVEKICFIVTPVFSRVFYFLPHFKNNPANISFDRRQPI